MLIILHFFRAFFTLGYLQIHIELNTVLLMRLFGGENKEYMIKGSSSVVTVSISGILLLPALRFKALCECFPFHLFTDVKGQCQLYNNSS